MNELITILWCMLIIFLCHQVDSFKLQKELLELELEHLKNE
mgnify:CR=1 FL=1